MIMARIPRGKEVLTLAQQQLAKVSDANEMRILLAVVLPLLYSLSTQKTALVVGRSPRWVTGARNSYIRNQGFKQKDEKWLRNSAHMSTEQEINFLSPFLEDARQGKVLIVNDIHNALEKHLGRKVALATAYNLLHRHGWRKLAPDKRNVAADVKAQEEWKKNCPNDLLKSNKSGEDRVQ
jgi:transposase